MTYIRQNNCAICGSAESVDTRIAHAPYFLADLVSGFEVRAAVLVEYERCAGCGTWIQNPRLDDETIHRYYADGIYRKTLGMAGDVMDRDELNRAKTDAELILKHIGVITSHLDIGCSRGYFLQQVNAKVKTGVEPNLKWPVEGINVRPGIDSVLGKYDLVSLIHVLEHECYPVQFLQKAANHLTDDGKLVVEVPSWQSKGGPLRLAHLWHWEPDALKRTLKIAGLKLIDITLTPHLFVVAEKINER